MAERKYPTSKVSGPEDILHVQGKEQEQRLRCEEIPHVQGIRNPRRTVGAERGHQRANRLKPQSQKTSQSDHMDHSLV